MGRVSTQTFSPSDSQADLVSKLNYNFNELVGSYGGTLGDKGPTGERGAIGLRGPAGSTGYQGKRGSRWFAGSDSPTGPAVNYGDYWIDLTGNCYKFSSSGWGLVTSLRTDPALFKFVDQPIGPSGSTGGSVLVMDQINPDGYSLVFADNDPASTNNLNPQGAKFVISTDPDVSGSYLMEFTKGDQDIAGSTGATSDSVKHPIFSWYGPAEEGNLNFSIPGANTFDLLYFDYGGGTGAIRTTLTLDAGSKDITFGEGGSLGGAYFVSSDRQNWITSGSITLRCGISGLSTYGISDSAQSFDLDLNVATFGRSSLDHLYQISLTPSVSDNTGYVRVYRDSNSTTSAEVAVPFVNKVYLNPAYFPNLSDSSSTRFFLVRSTLQSGSVGSLECFSARENGKIYTKKTSERYYNLTTAEFTYGS
jgi:hypothetical protein